MTLRLARTSGPNAPVFFERFSSMSPPAFAGLVALSAAALVMTSSTGCVPATNPFDPDTPAELQAKSGVRGRAAFPVVDGYLRPPAGIVVALESTADPADRFEVTTDGETNGAFVFRDVVPGGYVLRATANGYVATSNEIVLRAGEERDVGAIELGLSTNTASVGGTIIIAEGFASNARVAIVRADLDGSCPAGADAPPAFVTNADGTGAFNFSAIPEGTYQAWVLDSQYTPSKSEVFSVVADEDVTVTPMTVQRSSAILTSATGAANGIIATNTRDVDLSLVNFGEMTQMRFAEDNAANATTDWTAFAESFTYSIAGNEGERTIFLRLRNDCVTTPAFPASVLFDQTPPLFLSATIFGREGVGQLAPPSVVLGDISSAIPVQSRAFDVSGIAAVEFIVNGVPQSRVSVGPTAAFQAALVTAQAPLENGEGVSVVEVRLVDVAGNITPREADGNENAVLFRVIRDLSPPGTPLPTAEELTVTAPTTLLWLDERECPDGQDSSPFVCEANPPAPIVIDSPIPGIASRETSPLFLVRGGPDYPDFTPVIGPPFLVRVFVAGDTLFEIQAQDDAGNLSPGIARVLVHREEERTVFTAPSSLTLGIGVPPQVFFNQGFTQTVRPPTAPAVSEADLPLVASGGTAFVQLSPRPGLTQDHYYSYLVAQSVILPPLGVDRLATQFPSSIRKLSTSINNANGSTSLASFLYRRNVPALGVLSGALAWLEYNPADSVNYFIESPRPDFNITPPNADGFYAIDSNFEIYSGDDDLVDDEGEPAPGVFPNFFSGVLFFGSGGFLADCQLIGDTRCTKINNAWAGNFDRGPSEFTAVGDKVIFNGNSLDEVSLGNPLPETASIVGPALVMARVVQPNVDTLLRYSVRTIDIELGVPAGTLLRGVLLDQAANGTFTTSDPFIDDYPITGAIGAAPGETTTERILLRDDFQFRPNTREIDVNGVDVDVPLEVMVGVLIPDGVTATVRHANLNATGPIHAIGSSLRPVTIVSGELPTLAEVDAGDRSDVSIAMTAFVAEQSDRRVSRRAGLSLWNLGDDEFPTVGPLTDALLAEEAAVLDEYAQETQTGLTTDEHRGETVYLGDQNGAVLYQPEDACVVVFRPETDVEFSTVRLNGLGNLDDSSLRGFVWKSSNNAPFGDFELDPTFRAGFPFFPSGDGADEAFTCLEVVQENAVVADESGTIAPPVLRIDDTTVETVQNITFSATVQESVAGTFAHFHDVNAPIPVVEGQIVTAIMSDNAGTGDADMHLRFGAEATDALYDCRPYNNGSFETCAGYVVPPGVTELFVAFDVFTAPVDINIAVRIVDAGTDDVEPARQIPVTPGELLTVRASNLSAAFVTHDVFVAFDTPPTSDAFACEGAQQFDISTCTIIVPDGASVAHIGVDPSIVRGTESWQLDIQVAEVGSIVEFARLPMVANAPYVLSRTGGQDAKILIRRLDPDTVDDNLERRVMCDTTIAGLNGNTDCNCTVDDTSGDILCEGEAGGGGDPDIHVFYLVGQPGAGGNYNVTLDIPRTGCNQVEGAVSDGIFKAGEVYAVSINDSSFDNQTGGYNPRLQWIGPDNAGNVPQVERVTGASNPALGFVGSATEATIINNSLVITNLDAAFPRCNIEFEVPRRSEFHHLTASNSSVFAAHTSYVPDANGNLGPMTTLVSFDAGDEVSENSPSTIVATLPMGTRVLDSKWLVGEPENDGDVAPKFLTWIEKDNEEVVRVLQKRVDVDDPVCVVAAVNPPEDFLDVTLARFNESIDNRLVVAGNARVRPEARLFRLQVAPGCTSTLEDEGRRRLSAPPIAAAYDGGDLFFWDETDVEPLPDGGNLRHFDLREPTILHPGGRLSTTGFDVDNGDLAVALGPEVGRNGRLNEVVNGELVRHLLPNNENALFFHPRYIGTDGLAAMAVRNDPDTGEQESNLWLFARGNAAAPPIELAAAGVYLVPATVTADPLENARSPILESDGDLLALLGFQNGTDDRALTVFRLPSGREGTATPVGTVVSVPADVEQIFVTGDLVVLIFQNGNARVFQVGNGLTAVDVDPLDEDGTSLFVRTERVIGAADGNLFVLLNPGNLFELTTPRYLQIEIRPPEAYTDDATGPWPSFRLPAGAFIHAFPTIAAHDDDYLLYDSRANPPVLWHAALNGKNGTPDDGPSRPLTGGTERIGISATPRVDNGNVYYVRGVGNGSRALMRYQRR